MEVGEHLLSLVQELETFASSDALPDLLNLPGEAQPLAQTSRGWRLARESLEIRDVNNLSHSSREFIYTMCMVYYVFTQISIQFSLVILLVFPMKG